MAEDLGRQGLHVMAPLGAGLPHDDVRMLAKAFAAEIGESDERYIVTSAPSRRAGRIFIDYLRNGRGTTTVGAYSPRARPGFPVSTPATWQDVEGRIRPDAFTMESILAGTNRKGVD